MMDQLRHFLNSGLPTGKNTHKKNKLLPGAKTLGSLTNNSIPKFRLPYTKLPTTKNNLSYTRLPTTNIHHQRLSNFIKFDKFSFNDAPGEVKRGGSPTSFDPSKVTPLYEEEVKKFLTDSGSSLVKGSALTPEAAVQIKPFVKFGGTNVDIQGGLSRYVGGTGANAPKAPIGTAEIIAAREKSPPIEYMYQTINTTKPNVTSSGGGGSYKPTTPKIVSTPINQSIKTPITPSPVVTKDTGNVTYTTKKEDTGKTTYTATVTKPTLGQTVTNIAKSVGDSIAKGATSLWKAVTGKKN